MSKTQQQQRTTADTLARLAELAPSDIRRAWYVMRHMDMMIAQWTIDWMDDQRDDDDMDRHDEEALLDELWVQAHTTEAYDVMVRETRRMIDDHYLSMMPNITWSLLDEMMEVRIRREPILELLRMKGDDRDLRFDPSHLDTDWIAGDRAPATGSGRS